MFWYNGELVQANTLALAIDDPGLLYGATAFTTLRVYEQSLDSRLTNWGGHCDRIRTTLQAFGWQHPNWQQLRHGAETLMASFPVLRIAVFPDGREWILGRDLPADLKQRQQQGILAWLAEAPHFQRSLAERKTGNYLAPWLAGQAAQQHGAQEAILVDAAGNWLETSTGNLWGWQEGCWWTPPLTGDILPGLARSQLIQWLTQHNKTVIEAPWQPDRVENFETIVYTNSVVEVVPIHTILRHATPLACDPCHPSLNLLRDRCQS